ncbi:hypothetical protein ACH5RR_032657 [Cinchona calisaya]|uniref:Uncharacterized protein n=1 Tax=Cinchona calisaya TaxID=153742 RepID=A0ABD2YIP9_9GENT
MSRCFPFPPPGYEKEPTPEDLSVLKKEKQREKKQKKEKKEEEKREGKEKKDKDRSDGKHRDKKDRKEKHKDRKDKHKEKKKERSKDKDKSSTSETSKVSGLPEAKGVEKLKTEDGNSYSAEEKNHTAQSYGQNGDRTVQRNLLARKTEESKFVQALDGRTRIEEKIAGNELVEKFSVLDRKRDDESHRFAARNPGNLAEEKGKSRDKQSDKKMDGGQGTFSGNSMVHNLAGTNKGKVEGILKVVEKNDGRRVGEKEKTKERDDKQGDKYKDKDKDKKSHGKDKDREKEKKKEKVKEKSKHKKIDREKPEDISRSGLFGIIDNKSASLSSEIHINANVEGNLKKRKEVDINGFLHDTEVRPNKLQRYTSHQVVENGRKLEACQIPTLLSSDKLAVGDILKVDEKEGRKNGIIESLPLPANKPMSSSITADVDQMGAVSRKSPHPDSKYLSQVLSVPKMDEWSEFDDQDWLFTSQESRNLKVGISGVGEGPQVWSDALHLDSADIVALPFVIPY